MYECMIICQTPLSTRLRCTWLSHLYVVRGTSDNLLAQDVQFSLEALFECGVGKFLFQGSSVGQPVKEEKFAAVHTVMALILEIEDAHSGLVIG